MYLTSEAVVSAINAMRRTVHPFIGITFLACKRYELTVGEAEEVSIDALTRDHLNEYHRIDRRSSFYFQPFGSGSRWWVDERYPSTGLQTVNTQTFQSVFIHPRKSKEWGFVSNYLDKIEARNDSIIHSARLPADALAIWLMKDAEIGEVNNYESLTELFFEEFKINAEEKERLFSERVMSGRLPAETAFSSEPLEMTAVARHFPLPPDAEAEGGRTIVSMNLSNTGPAEQLALEYGPRLTMVTGDNGLGKSFLLDFTWWAATGSWADRQPLPRDGRSKKAAAVEYELSGNTGRLSNFRATFDQRAFRWKRPDGAMTVEALAVFSRADGSFALADPVRDQFNHTGISASGLEIHEVWNGRDGLLEGLIRDWVRWQMSSDRKTFDLFAAVLKRLSPEDLGPLTPGTPIRLPGDPREIPTIQHRYATIPVTHASSGVQRVLLLAYLMIWSWQEHEIAAERLGRDPLRRMMVVVDELEAHLHPKWQRIVLPALMGVGDLLSSDLALQVVAATHSPMILASMETTFNSSTDLLYHLYGVGNVVKLEATPFVKYGDASGWLTSPLFGLRHARSQEAERAIEKAKNLQLADEPEFDEIKSVSSQLKLYLAGDDKFWPRWLYFAEQHGVIL